LTNICAISTNGEMKDGGVYYLISRTLGKNLGGAAGIVLIISHSTCMNIRLYYLSRLIIDLYEPKTFTGSADNDAIVLQIILCVVVFLFDLLGDKKMLYFLVFVAAIVVAGVICIYIGFFAKERDEFLEGFSFKLMKQNWYNSSKELPPLSEVGVLFSSTNGVMTVADFGGNLNPPQKSIPIGGFTALIVSSALFLVAYFLISATVNFNNAPQHFVVLSQVSISPLLSNVGFIAACFGSSLTMSSGGARIVRMMIDDGLLPKWLSLCKCNNESLGPLLVISIIFLGFAFIKNPKIALEVTNISFLVPLALSNWSVFMCASAHYPGFRPTFKYFNKWFALFLTLFCCVRAFIINWYITLIFLVISIIIYLIYAKLLPPGDVWGSVLGSQIFYSTMEEALKLYEFSPHVKTYRSNILLVTTKKLEEVKPAIDLLNHILNRHGMLCVGRIIESPEKPNLKHLLKERDKTFLTDDEGYRTFYDVIVSPSFKEAVNDMLLQIGIGVMRPNTLCLEFPENWQETGHMHFVGSLCTALDAKFSVTILRHADLFYQTNKDSTIDVWWLIDDGGLSLLLPYLLSKQKQWKNAKIRLMTIAYIDEGDTYEKNQETMKHLLYKFRIKAEVVTIEVSLRDEIPSPMAYANWRQIIKTSTREGDIDHMTMRYLILSDLIRQYSLSSSFIALTMTVPHDVSDSLIYMAWLDVMSNVNVPFLFIRGNGENVISIKL
jgi:solute carrier family 12 sodium/potassium/chloride transporter 2